MSTALGSSAMKLEPFLLMSKSATGAAACKLIEDATSTPGLFVFAELLQLPNIKDLANNPAYAPHHDLLEHFAYKTYEDYRSSPRLKDTPLNSPQLTKLKHLTLVSLSMQNRILPYAHLLQALDMPSIRQLEDLIIDAIYLDIVKGKLDQKEQRFEVDSTLGRDLEPGKLGNLVDVMQDWSRTITSQLTLLDTKLSYLASQKALSVATSLDDEELYQANLKEAVKKSKASKKQASGAGGGSSNTLGGLMTRGGDDQMDVDVPIATATASGLDNGRGGKSRKPTAHSDTKQYKRRSRF